MTLPAVETWDVRGVIGPSLKVGPYCSNPTCTRLAEHAHHIVRRSQLAGDYHWVEIDGKLFGNLTGLCPGCHDLITGVIGGHKAAIRYLEEEGIRGFWWCLVATGTRGEVVYAPIDLIDPQPPTPDSLAASPTEETGESEKCPTCGHLTRLRPGTTAVPRLPGRKRKSWGIKVPDDAQEDGADALDSLLDDLAPLFGYQPTASARYYVVMAALVYAQQDRKRFIDSIRGVGA